MEELLQAPTDGVGDAIVIPPILASQFELKPDCLILLRLSHFMLILFPFSLEGAARTWLEKLPPNSITTWNDLVSKFVNQFFPPSRTTNLRNEITRFQQRFGETFTEAWDRFKDLLNKCPHHRFSPLYQIDTFYNGLNQSDQDSLNSAAGQMQKALQERPQGTFTSNTIPNPREEIKAITIRSGIVLAEPSVPLPTLSSSSKEVDQDPEIITDQSSRLNKEKLQDKSDIQVHKFLQMFKKLYFNISLAEALALMPKYAKMYKDLLSDKEKLLGLANTSLTKNCSAVLLKKLPEKLGDPRKFNIPCDFLKLEKCMALADLGASINVMPLSTSDSLLEEFTDELALLDPFPTGNDDDNFNPEADLREIEYLLYRDPSADSSPTINIDIIDPILERFTDEPALVYSFSPRDNNDDLFNFKSDNEE
ncbi:reverse transcriptase domain-containing protein [Tanacetum coccineum]